MPFGPPPATASPLASPFGDFGTGTCHTPPARYARALALGLARWCAASDEGARSAGRAGWAVGPEVPVGGAGGLPTRLEGDSVLLAGRPHQLPVAFVQLLIGAQCRV